MTATVVEEGDEPERSEPEGGTNSGDPAQQGSGPAAQLSPKCAGMGKRAKCWQALANKPGCYMFNRSYNPSTKLTWSGACAGGVAVGQGTIVWKRPGDSAKATGILVRGKRRGRWVSHYNGPELRRDRRTGESV